MPTREHIEALAAAMAARPLAYYRSGRMGDPPSVVAMQRRAQRLCAAISSDPAAMAACLPLALWIRYTRRRPSRASGSRLGARP